MHFAILQQKLPRNQFSMLTYEQKNILYKMPDTTIKCTNTTIYNTMTLYYKTKQTKSLPFII
jgi:hypothetical protein